MISTFKRIIASVLALILFVGAAPLARAASTGRPASARPSGPLPPPEGRAADDSPEPRRRTPARLS